MIEQQKIWRPHVTVATVVHAGDRFLMVEEAIRGQLRYNQPAGHLECGETLAEAAIRETLEETAWDVALDHFIGSYQWWSPVHHDHILRFAFAAHTVREHASRQLDTGIQRALWLTRQEIAALGQRLRSPMVLACIDDWLNGQRSPLTTLKSLMPAGAAA